MGYKTMGGVCSGSENKKNEEIIFTDIVEETKNNEGMEGMEIMDQIERINSFLQRFFTYYDTSLSDKVKRKYINKELDRLLAFESNQHRMSKSATLTDADIMELVLKYIAEKRNPTFIPY